MAVSTYGLVQSAGALYRVSPDGTQAPVGLPAGVTVSTLVPVRAVVFNKRMVLTNGVSRNVTIDINQIARLLQPRAPNAAVTVAVGAAGSLTGTYTWWTTFAIMEGDVVIAESDFSPISAELVLSADQANLSAVPVSIDPGVNARRLYRTTSDGGESKFLVTTIMDNSTTTYTDNATDEALAILPAEESLGVAFGTTEQSRLTLLAVWKDRIWAVPDLYPDRIYFSGNRIQYGWNADYYFVAGAEGLDNVGVTAIVARKNELFVGRRRSLHKITGDTLGKFGLIDVPGGIGVWAPESVVLIRDFVYFLAEDGVYRWDGNLTNLSKQKVHSWFTVAGTFNLARLRYATAHYNQTLDTYELFLADVDSLVNDRWVSYDLTNDEWLGPHRTDAYTPSCAGVLDGTDGRQRPAVGASNGNVLLKNSTDWTDGTATPIALDIITNPMHVGDVEHDKVWGELEMHQRALATGTVTVGCRTGNLEAMTGPIALVSLTRVGAVATALSVVAHYYGNGDVILISGCTGASTGFNGLWPIRRTGTTSFEFDLGVLTPTSPAAGSPTSVLPIRADQADALQVDRNRLGRLGVGRVAQLQFTNSEADQAVYLRGFTIHEVNKVGRR